MQRTGSELLAKELLSVQPVYNEQTAAAWKAMMQPRKEKLISDLTGLDPSAISDLLKDSFAEAFNEEFVAEVKTEQAVLALARLQTDAYMKDVEQLMYDGWRTAMWPDDIQIADAMIAFEKGGR